jgi:flagellar biosynthesis/type III secretory pathway chaperone
MTMKQSKPTKAHELYNNLQISQKLAEDILTLLKDENKAIRAMDTQTLVRLARQKEDLLAKIHYIDKRVKDIIDELVTAKIPGEQQKTKTHRSPTKKLPEVAALLPEGQAKSILQYHKNLKKLRQEIHTRNLINKRFTSDTLLCINDAIVLITDQPVKNNTYGSRGIAQYAANPTPTMISREV